MTHYSTLGVAETASPDEIKQAYRKLANQHHPDKGGDTAQFQKIQEAYNILGDDQQRAQYDAERRGGGGFRFTVNGQPFEHQFGGGMEDLFSQFGFNPFGGDPFAHMRQPRRNKDLRVRIVVDLADTLKEQTKTISVQTSNGERTTVEVNIPKGVTSGTQIKYSGLGDNLFNTLQRGDLYVQFEVVGHPDFEVHGIDLVTELKVSSIEAIVGCEKTVHGLDGKEFSVTIPKFTQHEAKFRLRDQGLWGLNQPVRGSLIVIVILVTPELNDSQFEMALNLYNSIKNQ